MSALNAWLATAVAWIGLVSSAIIGYLAYSLNRQAQRSQTQQSVGELYGKLIMLRCASASAMRCYRREEVTC
jgi:hypothetical protein